MNFPAVDPIPVPAPIWLLKLLSYVTLALHFSAVMIVVGSLLLVIYHNLQGRSRANASSVSASFVLARRLPGLMTWVINLGIPPLLFAQVLYGRAIYSSSVLIGVMWFSVIPLLMLAYWLFYRIVAAIEAKKPAWPLAVLALFVTVGIGQIYAMNMTLMLRPEAWVALYQNSPSGLQGPGSDSTMMPRWLFIMAGGLVFGGLWALMLSNMKHIGEQVPHILRRSGGFLAVAGVGAQIACAMLVLKRQPEGVLEELNGSVLHSSAAYLFLGPTVLAGLLALFQGVRAKSNVLLGASGVVLGLLGNIGSVIYRDGLRDFTLKPKGFDVWDRVEATNWSVVIAFLLLFVIMLGVILWLLMVMRRATAPSEQAAL